MNQPQTLIDDPGATWDEIVSRNAAKCAAENPTKPLSLTTARLPLLKEPRPVRDDTPREVSQIDPKLRDVFRGLIKGELPWPLLLTGKPGRGKTAAVLCLADYVQGAAYFRFPRLLKSFLWSSQPSGVAIMRQKFDEHARPERQLDWRSEVYNEFEFFNLLTRVPLLVIDDVATRGSYTDSQFDNFYEVLDDRKRKPTVIASNLSLDELGDVFDDRIKSRIARGTVFTLGGPDRRIAKRS